jgi:uncharacterized membrane protein YvbJ
VAYCTNCGTEYQEGQRFCGNCGANVAALAVSGLAPEVPRVAPVRGGGESLGKLAALLVGIVVVFVLMVYLVIPFVFGFFRGLLGA